MTAALKIILFFKIVITLQIIKITKNLTIVKKMVVQKIKFMSALIKKCLHRKN